MTHGEGGEKHPTLTKNKMSACVLASKQVSVHFGQENMNSWFGWEK
jgi:hypothetical protein